MFEKIKAFLMQEANIGHYIIGSLILLLIVVVMVISGCTVK